MLRDEQDQQAGVQVAMASLSDKLQRCSQSNDCLADSIEKLAAAVEKQSPSPFGYAEKSPTSALQYARYWFSGPKPRQKEYREPWSRCTILL
eukprot:g33097.t1